MERRRRFAIEDHCGPFHSLCQEGNPEKVEGYLKSCKNLPVRSMLDARENLFGYMAVHVAASYGHFAVLRLLLSMGANPNAQDWSGRTPLHLSAKRRQVDCVQVLLQSKADPTIKDKDGRTAKDLASLPIINSCLAGEEIVTAAERNTALKELEDLFTLKLGPRILDRALIASVRNGNMANAGYLIIKGASNIDEVLSISDQEMKDSNLRISLLCMKAALKNDWQSVVDCSPEVRDSFTSVALTSSAIEIAIVLGHTLAMEELLSRTGITAESVNWSSLGLPDLQNSLLSKFCHVQQLNLSGNRLQSVPLVAKFQQLRKLHLQSNEIKELPAYVLQLEQLSELDLSRNRLTTLPELQEWSPTLYFVNLSCNKIQTIPGDHIVARVRMLNLSSNLLSCVPTCVCNFLTLTSLDLSDNNDIQCLPVQMGKLKRLTQLNLTGLNKLIDPPRESIKGAQECVTLLASRLYNLKPFYRAKLAVVGRQNRGKTTLVARLQGKPPCATNESTAGIVISEWEYKPSVLKKPFSFSVWDFGGQEEYHATHQCFLSERSMYIVVFSLVCAETAVEEVSQWLNNIALRTPQSCVFIVASHLDEVSTEQRPSLNDLLNVVSQAASKYAGRLQIVDIRAVGLNKDTENVSALRESIYKAAGEYRVEEKVVMGQMVPSAYHQIDSAFSKLQKDFRGCATSKIRPIMHKAEYKAFVNQNGFTETDNDEELRAVTEFLTMVGTILHYDDRSNNIDDLYFVDPTWLCDMMSKFVAVRNYNPLVSNGVVQTTNIAVIFRDERFPAQYFHQYLTLLDRFGVAFALDKRRILIPSMLPSIRPPDVVDPQRSDNCGPLLIKRYIVFHLSTTPSGFWSRLICALMRSIPEVQQTMEGTISGRITSPSDTHKSRTTEDSSPQSEDVAGKNGRLEYWSTGMLFHSADVCFRAESLAASGEHTDEGILVASSPNERGKGILGHVIDLVKSLFYEWFRGGQLQHLAVCYECTRLNTLWPYNFAVEDLNLSETATRCGNGHEAVPLSLLVPDLLLQDLAPRFILDRSAVEYQEKDENILGAGGFAKVYLGKCRGREAAIKVYQQQRGNDAIDNLRKEALLLQKFHHPCLVCLIGVCPTVPVTLLLEVAPLGSLEKQLLQTTRLPIHRVVVHRILVQVAAALRTLHSHGVIFRDLKASNVLLWSLDPWSLCHCKIADFGVATQQTAIGATGVEGTKGFTAPEVLQLSRQHVTTLYNHQADIFSFGMLVFQAITRTNPFQNYKEAQINAAILRGERPKIKNSHSATYWYLSKLTQLCWLPDPSQRPTTDQIIEKACLCSVQSVMGTMPLPTRCFAQQACVVRRRTSTEGDGLVCTELVVCTDGTDGKTLVDVHEVKRGESRRFVIDGVFDYLCSHEDYVLVTSRARPNRKSGITKVLDVVSGQVINAIRTPAIEISCITCSSGTVYFGTGDGCCMSFSIVAGVKVSDILPAPQLVSQHAIDGILATSDHLWVSHGHAISLLSLDTLEMVDTVTALQRKTDQGDGTRLQPHKSAQRSTSAPCEAAKTYKTSVGGLWESGDGRFIWSANEGLGSYVCAWSVQQRSLVAQRDVKTILASSVGWTGHDVFVTAVAPALDVAWVGASSGHILVLHAHDDGALMWFRPYMDEVAFLSCVPVRSPTTKEEATEEEVLVVSGGQKFVPSMIHGGLPEADESVPGGTLVVWESFPYKMCRQIATIERGSSTFLANHRSVEEAIIRGGFTDGTNLLK